MRIRSGKRGGTIQIAFKSQAELERLVGLAALAGRLRLGQAPATGAVARQSFGVGVMVTPVPGALVVGAGVATGVVLTPGVGVTSGVVVPGTVVPGVVVLLPAAPDCAEAGT